jgi:tRNA(Ile)-lysidine synthase
MGTDIEQSTSALVAAVEQSLLESLDKSAPVCLAYSGGLDSTVLLHVLSRLQSSHPLRAIHIDHGLQAQSQEWALHCRDVCAEFAVPFSSIAVRINRDAGAGLEAAAREARYAALSDALADREVLLTAHHRRDQMETLLLQLFRGAGVHGLAAMPVRRTLAARADQNERVLVRPMLDQSIAGLQAYASHFKLRWIEDPSNAEIDFDRNYLRHELLPLIAKRWPAAESAVARSARLCAEAAEIVDDQAGKDVAGLCGNRLSLKHLERLSEARQRNGLRYALRQLGLAVPSARQLGQALATMLETRADGQPVAAWPGVRLRRYRDDLWLFAEQEDPAGACGPEDYIWPTDAVLEMGAVRGNLQLQAATGSGIAVDFCAADLRVKFRTGGEQLRPGGNARTRELKKLLQESDIVPWMRRHIPLVYAGEQLLAVGDIWVNADFAAAAGEPGRVILWRKHAPLR